MVLSYFLKFSLIFINMTIRLKDVSNCITDDIDMQ